jgi:hypothetical protein
MDVLKERRSSFQRRGAFSPIALLDDATARGQEPIRREGHLIVEDWIEGWKVGWKFSHFMENVLRVRLREEVCKSRCLEIGKDCTRSLDRDRHTYSRFL